MQLGPTIQQQAADQEGIGATGQQRDAADQEPSQRRADGGARLSQPRSRQPDAKRQPRNSEQRDRE
jgi:hypothetical protein